MDHAEVVLSGEAVLQLTFDPGAFGLTPLTARCRLDHPFYVKNRGWSSFYPSLTVVHHGIPCYDMEVGAVCLPPGHRDARHADDSLVFDTFRRYRAAALRDSRPSVLTCPPPPQLRLHPPGLVRRLRPEQHGEAAAGLPVRRGSGAPRQKRISRCSEL